MNGIFRFESSAHRQAELLLPWYVNHTLEGDELEQVQQHLEACANCQQTASELRGLQQACVERAAAGDPAASLARLRRRIDATADTRARDLPRRVSWLSRSGWQGAPPWLQWAASGQTVAIVIMAGFLFADAPPGAGYRTLGDADATVPAAAQADPGGQLVVVFDPQISAERMQALLRASQARIVDGPSEAGAYVLNVPAARVAGVQAALRAAPGVLLVESLDPVDRR